MRSSPSKPTGSIAGGRARPGAQAAGAVIPVETDGLHCGIAAYPRGGGRFWVIPVETDGLHCGPHRLMKKAWDGFASSPSKPTGSIAGPETGQSVRLATHVIPVETDGLHCGPNAGEPHRLASVCHPRRNRRAPLRGHDRLDAGCWDALAVSSPSKPTGSIAGRHDGWPHRLASFQTRHPRRNRRAPLRVTSCDRLEQADALLVIPVETDGLHCGSQTVVPVASFQTRHPRRNRRAPLRVTSCEPNIWVTVRVIPVETDGLHCGGV